jgi:hypothetical protein
LADVAQLAVPQAWAVGYDTGQALYRAAAPNAFLRAMRTLCEALTDVRGTPALVALAGLCHGVLTEPADSATAARSLEQVNTVLPKPYRMASPGRAET